MKKILSMIAALLSVAMLGSTAAAAATVDMDIVAVGADGEPLSGIPGADKLDDVGEYSLRFGSKEVMTVGENRTAGKYYHAEFDIPNTTETVYLAGLTADNVEEIQSEIIQSYVSGQPFNLTHLDFIDAEKASLKNTDSNLCWAASTADILAYTGWAKQAGFQNEDEVLALFANSYSNSGGYTYYALAWFFNNASIVGNSGVSYAKILNYPDSGGYLRNYAFDMVSSEDWLQNGDDMNNLLRHLKAGDGCSLGLALTSKSGGSGGHAVTGWGLVTDNRYADNDPERFKALFITDSDSDVVERRARENAPNIMNMYPLYVNSKGVCCFDYDEELTAALEDVVYLVPYSKKLPRETNFVAMRSKAKYADLTLTETLLTDSSMRNLAGQVMESGTTATLRTSVINLSDQNFRSDITLDLKITNQKNQILVSEHFDLGYRMDSHEYSDYYSAKLKNAPAGDYTVTCVVNDTRTQTEAFYYNNTKTMNFQLRDSYRKGDVNGDGTIDVQDVTMLQKHLVDYDVDWSEKAAERAGIRGDELSIADATLIQGYLTEMETAYPIGEKMLHTMI